MWYVAAGKARLHNDRCRYRHEFLAQSRRRHGAAIFGVSRDREEFGMNDRLLVIDVHPVVSHEHPRRRAVPLGVDVLVQEVHGGKERRFGLHVVLVRELRCDGRSEELLSVIAGAPQGCG